MVTGVAPGLQSRRGAPRRPGWVRFPHVPAILCLVLLPGPRFLTAQAPEAPVALPGVGPSQEAARDTVPPVSPLGAFGRSLVLPGWGQTALDRPFRGAVYFALETASLYMVFKTQSKLRAALRAEPPDEDLVRSRRGQREDWIVLSVFWAFLSGLDAWVSAHLWDFEAEVEPPEEAGVGLALRVRVPVGPP